jgi:hypothetical protein
MKKNNLLLGGLAIGALFISSCAVIPTPAGVGALYTGVNFPSPNLAVEVESNVKPTKVGKAEAQNILGVAVIGDCSIDAAMKAGQITKIHHVDSRVENVLGLFAKRITIVYGE